MHVYTYICVCGDAGNAESVLSSAVGRSQKVGTSLSFNPRPGDEGSQQKASWFSVPICFGS